MFKETKELRLLVCQRDSAAQFQCGCGYVGGVPPHRQAILQHQSVFNSILRLSNWIEHQTPSVKGRPLTPLQTHPQVQVVICSEQADTKSSFNTSDVDLINLLEQLPELRKTVYLLGYRFTIKGCNSGTAT